MANAAKPKTSNESEFLDAFRNLHLDVFSGSVELKEAVRSKDVEQELQTSIAYTALEAAVGFSKSRLADLLQSNPDPRESWKHLLHSKTALAELKTDKARLEKLWASAEAALETLSSDTSIINLQSQDYPRQLKLIANPPPVLYARGDIAALHKPGVCIVGSRSATPECVQRAAVAARLLKGLKYNVVSGLARGIDTAAHLSALQFGAHTIAVIGTPIDKYYPAENRGLQDLIALKGTLVSQFSPLHPVQKYNFPLRNVTMSGLTFATVIVEAGETSGALTQARACLSQKRKLFIMQNQIDKPGLTWPKKFLERGGIPLREMADLERELSNMQLRPERPQRSEDLQEKLL